MANAEVFILGVLLSVFGWVLILTTTSETEGGRFLLPSAAVIIIGLMMMFIGWEVGP